jgi:hypothetical protein
MTTTLELHARKIQWFCQQGEGFCMHVFSSSYLSELEITTDHRSMIGKELLMIGGKAGFPT